MGKTKMTKDTVPEGFTLKLALVDALPVLFFAAGMITAGVLIKSPLFIVGALLCLFAGAAKVLWKIIVVIKKKNIWWLFMQMRILMPVGMVMMITAAVMCRSAVNFGVLLGLPQAVFFAAGIIGMIMMFVFAFKFDSSDVKANWIEQLTNGAAQLCFFVGFLLTAIMR